MARGIILKFGDESCEFDIVKVDRDKLYGRKERVIVDDAGSACAAAHLTADGGALVPAGGTAMLYVDASFDTVERAQLVGVDAEGNPLPTVPSTLGVEQPLTGPVDARRLLDHTVTSVYQLQPTSIGPALLAALDAGKIFESRFSYRDDYDASPLFVLKNADGIFALVTTPTDFPFVAKDTQAPVEDDSDAGGDDDLDFSMM